MKTRWSTTWNYQRSAARPAAAKKPMPEPALDAALAVTWRGAEVMAVGETGVLPGATDVVTPAAKEGAPARGTKVETMRIVAVPGMVTG